MTQTPAPGAPDDLARTWGSSWQRYLFPAFWLIYLFQTVGGVHKHSHGAAAVIGYAIIVAFAVVYLVALPIGWYTGQTTPRWWAFFLVAVALTAAECVFAAGDALVFVVYLAVLCVSALGHRSVPFVALMTLATALLPRFVPGWGGSIDYGDSLTVLLVAFAMFGFFMIMRSNVELSKARAEVARLAAENERSRIARDLHDLLGHSLTTITVKAELARRLVDRDPARSAEEIAAVEQLSRRTLGEVRAAVSGYRDVTLAGELATSREVLRASGITARLPGAIDAVDADAAEPFGWVVREAVTNVVRHSRAQTCTITVGPRWIEISDDGRGSSSDCGPGNGLRGLRERLGALGGTVSARSTDDGWTVRAELPPIDAPARRSAQRAEA